MRRLMQLIFSFKREASNKDLVEYEYVERRATLPAGSGSGVIEQILAGQPAFKKPR